MPDTFCSSCKKTTSHKAIMCRIENSADATVIQNVKQWFSLLLRGAQYYKMEERYFCRVCNQQNVHMQVLINPNPLVINAEAQPESARLESKQVNAK